MSRVEYLMPTDDVIVLVWKFYFRKEKSNLVGWFSHDLIHDLIRVIDNMEGKLTFWTPCPYKDAARCLLLASVVAGAMVRLCHWDGISIRHDWSVKPAVIRLMHGYRWVDSVQHGCLQWDHTRRPVCEIVVVRRSFAIGDRSIHSYRHPPSLCCIHLAELQFYSRPILYRSDMRRPPILDHRPIGQQLTRQLASCTFGDGDNDCKVCRLWTAF